MAKDNSQSNGATATLAPSTKSVGTITAIDVIVPDLSPAAAAAKDAIEQYKTYSGMIDSEEMKLFVHGEMTKVLTQKKKYEGDLKKITEPLLESRRQSLAATKAAESVFAPIFAYLDTGHTILKQEYFRWEKLQEDLRKAAEIDAQRRANEEKRRLEEEARKTAEEAAEKEREAQARAAAAEAEGRRADAERIRQAAQDDLELAVQQVEETMEQAEFVTNSVMVPTSSIKVKGTGITSKWVAQVVDVKEILAGIVDGSTPLEAVRVKVNGKIRTIDGLGYSFEAKQVEAIEINLPWFNDAAKRLEREFSYRGMKAVMEEDLRHRL